MSFCGIIGGNVSVFGSYEGGRVLWSDFATNIPLESLRQLRLYLIMSDIHPMPRKLKVIHFKIPSRYLPCQQNPLFLC